MSWSSRRKTAYISFFLLISFIVAGAIFYFGFYEKPTCFDGKQNGDEAGIDCGGSCQLLCSTQIAEPVVLWSRAFMITEGVYNVIAYVENPNADSGIPSVSYTFKLFDDRNILIAERKNITFISPNGISPIFEGGIMTGERIPARTFFELGKSREWNNAEDLRSSLTITNKVLSNPDSLPRIDATISNSSVDEFADVEVVATVFDVNDNAIASSKTFVNLLPKRSSQSIVFTWPQPFPQVMARIEIIPRIPLLLK